MKAAGGVDSTVNLGLSILPAAVLVSLLPAPPALLRVGHLDPDFLLASVLKHGAQSPQVLSQEVGCMFALRPQHHMECAALTPGQLHHHITQVLRCQLQLYLLDPLVRYAANGPAQSGIELF